MVNGSGERLIPMTEKAESMDHEPRGLFITLEGVEGCGKTTQTELLASWCREQGHDCVVTREPGGTPLGEQVRSVVLDPGLAVDPLAELFLYLSARAQHVRTVIRPALEGGRWVLCDRFADSTLVYQGCGRGLGVEFVRDLNRVATEGMVPDITFVLDTDVRVGLERARLIASSAAGSVADRIESDSVEFHERVRHGFFDLAANEPGRVKIVEPGTVDEVFAAVVDHLTGYLKERCG